MRLRRNVNDVNLEGYACLIFVRNTLYLKLGLKVIFSVKTVQTIPVLYKVFDGARSETVSMV